MSIKRKLTTFALSLVILTSVSAQSRTILEVEELAAALVTQINANPHLKTVAVAELTALDYTTTPLGKYLTEELTIALIMHPDRNFQVINRGRLKALLEEAKLDADGLLAPENIPQLGRLRGIQMLIGGFIRPASDHIATTVKGVELETGDALVASRKFITMTLSLDSLNRATSAIPEAATESSPAAPGAQSTVTVNNLRVIVKGCRTQAGSSQLNCEFEITNQASELNLSIYATNTQVYLKRVSDAPQQPSRLQLGTSKGSQRVTSILKPQTPTILYATINTPTSGRQIAQINFKCYAPSTGLFDIQLQGIPVLN